MTLERGKNTPQCRGTTVHHQRRIYGKKDSRGTEYVFESLNEMLNEGLSQGVAGSHI
jgi:hypothetical protein